MSEDRKQMYRVLFHNQGHVYEVYARAIYQSDLYGFIEARDLVFETDSRAVVDPTEEKLRDEFSDTESLMLPLQSVIRIEQVKKRGKCVIRDRGTGEKDAAERHTP